jgi:hypothetical protein
MPCSHVLEFINLSMAVFTSLWQHLGLSNEYPCTNAKMLPTRGLPRLRCPLPIFYDFFKKISTITSRPIAQEKGFLDGNSILCRVMACVGWGAAVCSKFLLPMPPRLWHEDLRTQPESSGLRPTSFQKCSGDRLDSGQKSDFTNKTMSSYLPNLSNSQGLRTSGYP